MSYWKNHAEFADLKGKVLKKAYASGDEIYFVTVDDETYKLYHAQDCCEVVEIESIVGDLDDLLTWPILLAEEASGDVETEDEWSDSKSWTFYKIATIKGYVDIRWTGSSNGYYSESVDFVKV